MSPKGLRWHWAKVGVSQIWDCDNIVHLQHGVRFEILGKPRDFPLHSLPITDHGKASIIWVEQPMVAAPAASPLSPKLMAIAVPVDGCVKNIPIRS